MFFLCFMAFLCLIAIKQQLNTLPFLFMYSQAMCYFHGNANYFEAVVKIIPCYTSNVHQKD